jgi:uncharacterized protein YlxP (DUF503 family)
LFVGCCLINLHIPSSSSLKDKRQVLRSTFQRIRNKFEVAVAEVGDNEDWQSAMVGIVAVSNERHHVEETVNAVLEYIEQSRPDCEVATRTIELYHVEH